MESDSILHNEMPTNSGRVILGSQLETHSSDSFLLDPALFANLRDFAFTARQKTLLADFISEHSALVGAYENGRLPDKNSPEFADLRAFYETLKDAWFEASDSDPPAAVQAPQADTLLSYLRMFVELPEAEMLKLRDNFAALFPSLATKIRERQEASQPSSLADDEMCIFNNLRLCSMAMISPDVLCLLIPPLVEGENFFDPNTFLSLNASKSTFPLLAEFLRKNAPQAMNVMFGCDLNDAGAALVRTFRAEFKRQSQPQLTAAEQRLLKRRAMASERAAQPQVSAAVDPEPILAGPPTISAPPGNASASIPDDSREPVATQATATNEPITSASAAAKKPMPEIALSRLAADSIMSSVTSKEIQRNEPNESGPQLTASRLSHPKDLRELLSMLSHPSPSALAEAEECVGGPPTISTPPRNVSKSIPNDSTEPVPAAVSEPITSMAPSEAKVSAAMPMPDTALSKLVADSTISLTSKYIRDNDGKALSLSFVKMLIETFGEYMDYIDLWLEGHPEISAAFEQRRHLSPLELAAVDRFWSRLDMAKYRGEDAEDLQPETVKPKLEPTYFDDLYARLQGERNRSQLRTLLRFCERWRDVYALVATNERLDRGQYKDVEMFDCVCFGADAPSTFAVYAARSNDECWKIFLHKLKDEASTAAAGDEIDSYDDGAPKVELLTWEGQDISPDKDKSITRSLLSEGDKWDRPNDAAILDAHIAGRHAGRVFVDNNFKFALGECTEQGLPEGVDKALKQFKKGETSIITLQPKWGYGDAGKADFGIPPQAALEFEIHLKDFEKAKESWQMNDDEKLSQADALKAQGTEFFQKGKYKLAVAKYTKILDLLQSEATWQNEKKTRRDQLYIAAHLNLALCCYKCGDTDECIKHCDKVLADEKDNVKALYRRGQAYQQQNDFALATKDFAHVLELEADNKAAALSAQRCKQAIKAQNERDKKLYSNMFKPLQRCNEPVAERPCGSTKKVRGKIGNGGHDNHRCTDSSQDSSHSSDASVEEKVHIGECFGRNYGADETQSTLSTLKMAELKLSTVWKIKDFAERSSQMMDAHHKYSFESEELPELRHKSLPGLQWRADLYASSAGDVDCRKGFSAVYLHALFGSSDDDAIYVFAYFAAALLDANGIAVVTYVDPDATPLALAKARSIFGDDEAFKTEDVKKAVQKDGSLHIRIDLTVVKMDELFNRRKLLRGLLANSTRADVEVNVGNRVFKLDKSILAEILARNSEPVAERPCASSKARGTICNFGHDDRRGADSSKDSSCSSDSSVEEKPRRRSQRLPKEASEEAASGGSGLTSGTRKAPPRCESIKPPAPANTAAMRAIWTEQANPGRIA